VASVRGEGLLLAAVLTNPVPLPPAGSRSDAGLVINAPAPTSSASPPRCWWTRRRSTRPSARGPDVGRLRPHGHRATMARRVPTAREDPSTSGGPMVADRRGAVDPADPPRPRRRRPRGRRPGRRTGPGGQVDPAELPGCWPARGVALVFEKPSNRTRNSTEMAAVALGGHPVYIQGSRGRPRCPGVGR
jgi:hypothetical protein